MYVRVSLSAASARQRSDRGKRDIEGLRRETWESRPDEGPSEVLVTIHLSTVFLRATSRQRCCCCFCCCCCFIFFFPRPDDGSLLHGGGSSLPSRVVAHVVAPTKTFSTDPPFDSAFSAGETA